MASADQPILPPPLSLQHLDSSLGPSSRLGPIRSDGAEVVDRAELHEIFKAFGLHGTTNHSNLAPVRLSQIAQTPVAITWVGSDEMRRRIHELRPGFPEHQGSYEIRITDDLVEITAADRAGLVHSAAVLGQLTLQSAHLPRIRIIDSPLFEWRGLSLDVVRRFYPLNEIHQVIDLIAGLRMNVLHLHLSDDQGWRIQIPGLAELTERASHHACANRPGGFYSQSEIIELIDYAHVRGVNLLLETDFPGHTNAALHALAYLNPHGEPAKPYNGIDVGFSTLDPANPASYDFMDHVIRELSKTTTIPYLHIGGDEALTLDSTGYDQLMSHAIGAVQSHGLTPIVWQEAAPVTRNHGCVFQFWDSRADKAKFVTQLTPADRVILSPAERVYLDMKPTAGFPHGLEWAGIVPAEQAYYWDPFEQLPGLDPSQVLGIEAALWSETIESLDQATTLLLPRVHAVAEVAWNHPDSRNFTAWRTAVEESVWASVQLRG